MENKKLIVAYCRLSQEDIERNKDYSSSIYNQLNIIKTYAESIGLTIDKEYIDDGYSGINFDRPDFGKLKSDIDKGIISVVITKDISRLGRNFLETAYYISEYFRKNKIRYIAINDQYDSDNPNNDNQDIMLEIRSLINDRYVKDVSIKRKQVAYSKTNDGQFIGFMAPYGYKIKKVDNRRTLEIDEEAASIVKKIFTEIESGKTRTEVADMLNEEKIIPPFIYLNMTPCKSKKYYNDWSPETIYRIVKNKTYTGRIVKRKSIKKEYHLQKRDYILLRDREIIDNCHPAIINDELFASANQQLKVTKRKRKKRYHGFLLELVRCGTCGSMMKTCHIARPERKQKDQYYFQCIKVIDRKKCENRMISDNKLTKIVIDILKNIIKNYSDKDDIIKKVLKDLLMKEKNNLKISNLKDDIELHNNNIRNLYLQKTIGKIGLDEFVEKKNLETLLKEQSEKKLEKVKKLKNEKIRKQELLEKYHEFINDDDFINSIIRNFINEIIIYKDNTIKLSFKFSYKI